MRIIILILSISFTIGLYGQGELPHYFIEGDDVICQFDIQNLSPANSNQSSVINDFSEFDIFSIINSGEYKDWQKEGWSIHKVSDKLYQLRKNLNDFDDNLPPSAKYLIDGKFWNYPTSDPGMTGFDTEEHSPDAIFKAQQKEMEITVNGNAIFQLFGHKDAKRVILSGTFNHWNEQEISLNKTSLGWKIELDLPPGIYEYKFIVDGQWLHDPKNPLYVKNYHHTLNSILLIGDDAIFQLPGHSSAEKVVLSGSFNNWNERAIPMIKTPRGWACSVPLPPGKHYYKFIVDGQWINDPSNELIQRDRNGYVNSVLLIH